MRDTGLPAPTGAIREALARRAYERGEVRVADAGLGGVMWLVATHRGIFGIGDDGVRLLVHGWHFGLCRYGDHLYAFENCGQRGADLHLGRVVRIAIDGARMGAGAAIVTGLHFNCHQVAVIDGLLCVVDTGNQAIRRYTPEGKLIDVRTPFRQAPVGDTSGAYLHINTIAQVGDRIGLILHNGRVLPEKNSELAWLDKDWRVVDRVPLAGRGCHDIVADEEGLLWHSASMTGEIMRSDGLRVAITPDMMTRGIALTDNAIAVGVCTFGPRHLRGTLNGNVTVLDRHYRHRATYDVVAAPADIIAL